MNWFRKETKNALSFSLTFDPAVLSNPVVALGSDASNGSLITNSNQVAAGRLGLILTLPAGQSFSAGVRRIFAVTFTIAANTNADTTNIGFGNQPVPQDVTNAATVSLPAVYTGATVSITRGIEADVASRPNGNGSVSVTDLVLMGRFVAQLDTAANGGEFQCADCAPRTTRGDGVIGLADLVQAGRYVAGLDDLLPAGGPTTPNGQFAPFAALTSQPLASIQQIRQRARDLNSTRVVQMLVRETGTLVLTLNALGDENALSFGLRFNPSQWRYLAASAAETGTDSQLTLNTDQASHGQLGVVLALPAGQTFAAGKHELVTLTFEPVAGSKELLTGFAYDLVACEVISANALPLATLFSGAMNEFGLNELTNVSAASFRSGKLAPEQIVAAFGKELAVDKVTATETPLPTELIETRVAVTDSQGVTRTAPLFFVSPDQVNYQMPAETAKGVATVTVTHNHQPVASGVVSISAVAPGVFTDGNVVMRIDAAGNQSFEALTRFDEATQRNLLNPINLEAETEQVYLILYATGLRGLDKLGSVKCTIDGVAVEVLFAGEAAGMVGLDQINLRLPPSLRGRGEVTLALTVDGQTANAVRVSLK